MFTTIWLCIQMKYFIIYYCARKVDLSKGYWNPKGKLREAVHFLELMKQQYNSKKL